MLRSVSIQLMWADRPFPQRAAAAAAAGFDLVDLWDRRSSMLPELARACRDYGIGINGFFGNRDHSLCDPEHAATALDEIKMGIEAAVEVGARQLHLFSNAIRPGGIVMPLPDISPAEATAVAVDHLNAAADVAATAGIQLVLEHLNTVFLPGYVWHDVPAVLAVAEAVGRPEVGLAFDTFHQQLVGGRLTDTLVQSLPHLVRVDIAEVPGRHEPGHGEIDFHYLRGLLDELEWDGTMTFETVPSDGDPETAVRAIDYYFPPSPSRSTGADQRGGL